MLPIKPILNGLVPVVCSSARPSLSTLRTMLRRPNSSIATGSASSVRNSPNTEPSIERLSDCTCSKSHSSSSVATPRPSSRSKRHSLAALCCTNSTRGSKNRRSCASCSLFGSGNIKPRLRFELCGIDITSQPTSPSIHSWRRRFHNSG